MSKRIKRFDYQRTSVNSLLIDAFHDPFKTKGSAPGDQELTSLRYRILGLAAEVALCENEKRNFERALLSKA